MTQASSQGKQRGEGAGIAEQTAYDAGASNGPACVAAPVEQGGQRLVGGVADGTKHEPRDVRPDRLGHIAGRFEVDHRGQRSSRG